MAVFAAQYIAHGNGGAKFYISFTNILLHPHTAFTRAGSESWQKKETFYPMKNHCLIVDDNALVLETTACLVKHLTGLPVRCCRSGGEAIRIFEESPESFACVITDFNMPGINGLELGGYLHEIAPEVKLLLVTGNPGAVNEGDLRRCSFAGLLPKPYSLTLLREALAAILPDLNNFPAPATQDLYKPGVSFPERSLEMNRAVA